MTNEEYVNELIEIGNVLQIHPNSPKGKALKKAIELLRSVSFPERETLEKIGAEIADLQGKDYYIGFNICKNRVLEIIDKYIGGKE